MVQIIYKKHSGRNARVFSFTGLFKDFDDTGLLILNIIHLHEEDICS